MSPAPPLRSLPSVHQVLSLLSPAARHFPHALVTALIRQALDGAREAIRDNQAFPPIEIQVEKNLLRLAEPSLRHVINATGVILHTNLGRAPLLPATLPGGYSNLEYDLATGKRGKRDAHLTPLFERLLGQPAIAVNNGAAALYLALHELAPGKEVIVSRGELIEIGDGFRIPDIMARSGCILREVGTTNRTRTEDYRQAITDRTALLLRVHPSNFRMTGFTARPDLKDLVALGREHNIPVHEDLGSGNVVDLRPFGIAEPTVQESLALGVNLVSFSGDKLLGGPQAGILAGDGALVARLRRNPMFRALRLDKLICHTLENTLRALVFEQWDMIPALRMIRLSAEDMRKRSESFVALVPQLNARIEASHSVTGGGATPDQPLPTYVIAIETKDVVALERKLRSGSPPVIARIENDRLILDLRTVSPEEERALQTALLAD